VIVRPSYVLGGRAMQVVYDAEALRAYASQAIDMSPAHPLFLDRFLEDAFEVDVDALCDGHDVFVAGVQQHIEEAGIHSGDSACVLPPYKVEPRWQAEMVECTTRLARALRVVGLLNVQFAIKDDVVCVIEANPRASRTIPYVAKSIGLPLVRLATRAILGERLRDLLRPELLEPEPRSASGEREPARTLPEAEPGRTRREPESARAHPEPLLGPSATRPRDADPERPGGRAGIAATPPRFQRLLPGRVFVKMPVFSSNRFPEVDTLLGPEMRSTGEVLGIGRSFGEAYAKAALGAGVRMPLKGTAFVSVHDNDKHEVVPIVRDLLALGFHVVATRGTAEYLRQAGVPVEGVYKVNEGHPHIADRLGRGEVQLVINTPLGRASYYDEAAIRRAALAQGVPCITTLSGSRAMVDAIRTLRSGDWDVRSMQALDWPPPV
jgi:carbamoyl-phosphate synthase large subunit